MAKQTEFITCKQCGNVDPLLNKLNCSKCGAKNWGYKLSQKSKKGCFLEILGLIIILTVSLLYTGIKKYRENHWSQSRIESEFSKNVVVVYHEFVYELEFDDPAEDPLYFVKTPDGGIMQWKKGMQANSVTGCGLLIERDGTCATTKNLAAPWLTDQEMLRLRHEVKIFRELFNTRSRGHFKLFTIKLGYYPNESKFNSLGSFIPCKRTGSYDTGIDAITPSSHNTVNEFIHVNNRELNKGDDIYIMGYPLQVNSSEKMSTLTTKSKVDSLRSFNARLTEFYYTVTSLYTLEGAPVFDTKANVVGFCTIDENGNIKATRTTFTRKKESE